MEKVNIKSSKGHISAAVHYPQIKTDKLAILCPGYLDSKDYKHLVGLAEALCDEGYTSVRFDPTGTWESSGEISDYTTTNYLEDIKTVLEHMLSEVEYGHVLLGGHSRGGQLSILYAARDPRISIVLGIMASSGKPMDEDKMKEWEKEKVMVSERDLPGGEEGSREFRVPFSHAVDKNNYSGIEDVPKVKAPVVLVAGKLDDLVTPEELRELFDRANESKKFVIISNIGHNYRHNDDEIKIVNDVILDQLRCV